MATFSAYSERVKMEHRLWRSLQREVGGPENRRVVLKHQDWQAIVDPLWRRDGYESLAAWFVKYASLYGLSARHDILLDTMDISELKHD